VTRYPIAWNISRTEDTDYASANVNNIRAAIECLIVHHEGALPRHLEPLVTELVRLVDEAMDWAAGYAGDYPQDWPTGALTFPWVCTDTTDTTA
jgi:hypothetical protein